MVEDFPTGLNIHRRGWRSECCTPDPIAFTGCAPRGLLSTMVQQKRWATGLTEVFFGKHSPIMGMIFGKIQFRAGLSYSWLANWGLRSVFEVCYALLPPYCIITDTSIFPKVRSLIKLHYQGYSIHYRNDSQLLSHCFIPGTWSVDSNCSFCDLQRTHSFRVP